MTKYKEGQPVTTEDIEMLKDAVRDMTVAINDLNDTIKRLIVEPYGKPARLMIDVAESIDVVTY